MRSQNMLFDLLQTGFLMLTIAFVVFYVVLGDRLAFFHELMQTLMPFVYALVPFLVTMKVGQSKLKRMEHEGNLDQVYSYLTDDDRRHDLMVAFAIPVVITAVALIDGAIEGNDIVQALAVGAAAILWHRFLFEWRHDRTEFSFRDKLWDDMVAFSFPVLVMAVAVLGGTVDRLDVIQTVVGFSIQYGWRLFLFRRAAY